MGSRWLLVLIFNCKQAKLSSRSRDKDSRRRERLALCGMSVFQGIDEGEGHAVPFVLSQTSQEQKLIRNVPFLPGPGLEGCGSFDFILSQATGRNACHEEEVRAEAVSSSNLDGSETIFVHLVSS